MKELTIIAGPCSIDERNIEEAVEIGKIQEVDGVRCVGLKSVTSPRPFMGIDKDWFFGGMKGATPPSVEYARRIIKETGKFIALEMMDVSQLYPMMFDPIFDSKVFVWNPAINQLGWPMYRSATIASQQGWRIGLKNPKWVGVPEVDMVSGKSGERVNLNGGEKNWYGSALFVKSAEIVPVMIQRGIDTPTKGEYRNLPNHAASVKMRALGLEVYFDPSHTFGSNLRSEILPRTLEVLDMKMSDGSYIYSGILIEVGTSQTDTGQHITIQELKRLIEGVRKQRGL